MSSNLLTSMQLLNKIFDEAELMQTAIADLNKKHKEPDLNPLHCWEITGMCGVTLDVCATLDAAKNNAGGRKYWEIWEIKEGTRKLLMCSPTPTFVTHTNIKDLMEKSL